MRVVVLGGGAQGRYVTENLRDEGVEVTVLDVRELSIPGIECIKGDIRETEPGFFRQFDLVVDALPSSFGRMVMEKCIEGRKNLVSVSFMRENYLDFHPEAEKAGITIIPDAGVAPGLSNVLVGLGVLKLKKPERVVIKVGGFPENPSPPLFYELTWCFDDLIEEYTRPARIKRNGKIQTVDPLSTMQREGEGLESFTTDGLRSLLYTLPVPDMEERTLRPEGHLAVMRILKDLGAFEDRKRLKSVLSPWLKKRSKDILKLRVEIHGEKVLYFELEEKERDGITAMTRTTALSLFCFTKLMLEGRERKRGVIPPELITEKEGFLELLEGKGIKIKGGEG